MNSTGAWQTQDPGPLVLHPRAAHRAPSRHPRSAGFWKYLERQWGEVVRHCGDRESRRRLDHLRRRLASTHRGVRESAIAELEVAGTLVRRGSQVRWLPESRARTADLECHTGGQRFFIEVTAMIGAFRETHGIPAHRALFVHDPEGPVTEGDVLIHRILARIIQKARQLSSYSAPVLLALSVPPQEEAGNGAAATAVSLDLRRLAGAVTSILLNIGHLSGVMLSLWSVAPLPSTSNVRLANVGLVERTLRQREHPQVRTLVCNPAASAPLTRRQVELMRAML